MVATPRTLGNISVAGVQWRELPPRISVGHGCVSYEEYHPYGTAAWSAEKSSLEVSPKRYRYTGMERDEETGLQRHGVRFYAPWLGRWVSCDPIGLGGGLNRFEYARSAPTVAHDRHGLAPEKPTWTILEPESQPTALAEIARGNSTPETLDEGSLEVLNRLFDAPGEREHSERGIAILALDDGRIAVSSIVGSQEVTSELAAGSMVDWGLLLDGNNEFISPDEGTEVIGALLLHRHPGDDATPGTPSLAIRQEEGKALSGDLPYLLGANRPGSNTRGELPLDVPVAIGTLPASGKAFNVMARGKLTQEQSDAAFTFLNERLTGDFQSRALELGQKPADPVPELYTLDRAHPTVDGVNSLLRDVTQATSAPISFIQGKRKAASKIRRSQHAP